MKKIFRKLHLWLSVPFGLVITVICFTGAMLVFENEVTEVANRQLVFVDRVTDDPFNASEVATLVSKTLPDSVKVTGVVISSDPERAYKVNLSKPRRAFVYVDQYTGEIKGKNERLPFFQTMFRLHRWLMDSRPADGAIFWGKMIVGVSTLVFVVILITGLVIWVPKSRKALKNRLSVCATKGWKRLWYDLHVAGGFYALLLLLAMALTGLTWSFSWYRTGFYKAFGVEMRQETKQAESGNGKEKKSVDKDKAREKRADGKIRDRESADFDAWATVFDRLASKNPDYKQIVVSDGKANVSFDKYGNQRASDKYEFDKRSGEITKTELYVDADDSSKIRGWIYSVHVGSWGGLTTRILTFLAAIMGASLPLTGYYLWIRRLYRKKNPAKQELSKSRS